jgi:glucosylglycerate synthase
MTRGDGAAADAGAQPRSATGRPPVVLPTALAPPATADIAVAVLTYNNADTIKDVVGTAARGLQQYFPGATVALVEADAGSSDATHDLVAAAGLPTLSVRHEAPASERVTVPFHGVPGRGAGLRAAFDAAHRLRARALVLLEADAITVTPQWIDRLARPIVEDKADFVSPLYARRRYEGTITKLLLSPLVRALYGRRLHQPLGGQQALSARLLDHLLIHPKWDWTGPDSSDLWIAGTAIADGFSVCEAWLGAYAVKSRTRTTELPAMIAETLGALFTLMARHEDLWQEVRGSEALPVVGEPAPAAPDTAPPAVDAMLEGFRLGARDLTSIWEAILAPDTLGEVLGLGLASDARFRFSDDLWARVVYDFALGHHYNVVHREHLLRSLVPIYLGRTAAFVLATHGGGAAAVEAALETIGGAFERQKPYLVEHWR